MYPSTPSSFKIGITIILLASCNACNIKMWLRQQFFTFQTLKNKLHKLDELTDMIDLWEFPSLSLESPSVVASMQYVRYLYDDNTDNKSGSSVNELRCKMFTKKDSRGSFTINFRCFITWSAQIINIFSSIFV